MKTRDLIALGIPHGEPLEAAKRACQAAARAGLKKRKIATAVEAVAKSPETHVGDGIYGTLAQALIDSRAVRAAAGGAGRGAPYRQWGEDLEPKSVEQMRMACALPVAVAGALMPDAHLGYGLPIGGVLATSNAVIPYAVGVDIACRVKLSVFNRTPDALNDQRDLLKRAISTETKFGVGAAFKKPREHAVMDANWNVTNITKSLKDKAWSQLGTSGSGNHFVEFGTLEILDDTLPIERGTYLAMLSHSGSRGAGAAVCNEYSKIAQRKCRRDLQYEYRHLSWLNLDSAEGQEYWAAMELMGEYASANHDCIHRHVAQHIGSQVLWSVENHHNFAWKEEHQGRQLVVHRKGATPASAGDLGIIPGSMASPCYVVRGLGNAASLRSAAHGAGRVMSRTAAKKRFNWPDTKKLLADRGVELMSAGLDEVPGVYKNINEVMAAQSDLVEPIGRFQPKLVKMAPAGERPED
jgi:tRNA-splicing ligase RtcB (3'-phosphate/5'-hydroxy nucleic acid ligase)